MVGYEQIEVKRAGRTPSIVAIGDTLGRIDEFLPDRRVIVITDANVYGLYKDIIDRWPSITIGLGETNKTLATVQKIYERLVELNADRECFILGFGGGIVTDIAGFAASTYMRGLPFGFVATTLLSQVDASVGGKNGVNLQGFKNMVGTFNQPDFVLCDTSVLNTLPVRELRAGMAEIIKSGIIADPQLFDTLERHSAESIFASPQLLSEIISAAVKVKTRIVEADEKESGERKKLNLGHTIAHAIEKCSREFLHGEAVSIGLSMICRIAVRQGALSPDTAQRIDILLQKTGLPTTCDIPLSQLASAVHQDKKSAGSDINIVMPHGIGDCRITKIGFKQAESMILDL